MPDLEDRDDDLGDDEEYDDDLDEDDDEDDEEPVGARVGSSAADEVAAEGNRVVGARSLAVLQYIVRSIVDDPDSVTVDVEEGRNSVMFRLHVAPSDMGRVIGRRGRVAQAIRQLVRATASLEDVRATVDIVD